MHPTVRFAPSPTGYLHIGNARTALINRLFALKHGGRFILRLDDTDTERSRDEFAEAIVEDLAWLGIEPDLIVRQSDRGMLYEAAAARLKSDSRLYPCWETPDELDRKRKRQRARGLPPVYDRAALKLTAEERAALEASGRRPHWRFLLEEREVEWEDICRGPQHYSAGALSDPVLIREDGTCLYTFTSAVDDADLGVTHVIRGEDHVTNTAVQIQIFEALGHAPPVFAHHNLLVAASGEELSKRKGTLSLRALREEGYEPMAVASLAVLIGSSEALEAVPSLDRLAGKVDLARLSRAPSGFDINELTALNRRLVADMGFDDVSDRLATLGVGGGAAFWHAVRGNLDFVGDAAGWWRRIVGPIEPEIAEDDRPFLADAAGLLPHEPWDATTFGAWTAAVKAATGRSGKALFAPLRRALTGLDHGPELKLLLPLIGREAAIRRLAGRS